MVGRVEGHVRTLGIVWIAYSTLRVLSGWFVGSLFSRWGGFFAPRFFFLPGLLHTIGFLLTATGLLGVIAGWGLLERHSWARPLAIVLGVLNLFHFPIGTLLGIYTLWVLLPADSAAEYQRTARAM